MFASHHVAICGFSSLGNVIGNYKTTSHHCLADAMIAQAKLFQELKDEGYAFNKFIAEGEDDAFHTAFQMVRLGETRYACYWEE